MNRRHRLLAAGAALTLVAATPATAIAAPDDVVTYQDVNDAVAINTEDGASVFRLAFAVRTVADAVVDQENLALAYASCAECQTVALAFQVVLVMGDADIVTPVNEAVAYNDRCQECLTFASATQIVVGVGGPVRLTGEGRQLLLELRRRLLALEDQIDELTPAQLVTAVSAVEADLIALLSTQLVPVGREDEPADATTTTTVPPSTTRPPTSTSPPTTTSTTRPTTTSTGSTTSTEPQSVSSTTVAATSTPTTTDSSDTEGAGAGA